MAGIKERVNEFLETWEMRKAGDIPKPEDAKCTGYGVVLEDGNFALVDGDLTSVNCTEGLQEK